MVQITALMDNQLSAHRALIAEHGLSLFLEYNGRRILFDCGSGGHFLHNARKLGIDLTQLDGVVLSHNHYDHAAGLRDLVESGGGSRQLFTGPGFFEKKYARSGLCYTDLSGGLDPAFLARHGIAHRVVEGMQRIFPGVYLIGNFPRVHPMEEIPQRFVRRQGTAWIPDDFADEICLAAAVDGGLAVLVGCSHPGIVNMICHVRQQTGLPVKAVFGGTHLAQAQPERIAATVEQLHRAGVEILGLSHCSGEAVRCAVSGHPGIQSGPLGVGDCFFFDGPGNG